MALGTNPVCEKVPAVAELCDEPAQTGAVHEVGQADSWHRQIHELTWRDSIRTDDLWQAYLAHGWMEAGGIIFPSPGECNQPGFLALCRLASRHHRSIRRVAEAQQAREGIPLSGNRSLLGRPVAGSACERSESIAEVQPRAMGQRLRRKALYLAIRWRMHGEHPELLPVAFGYTADWFLGLRALEGADLQIA